MQSDPTLQPLTSDSDENAKVAVESRTSATGSFPQPNSPSLGFTTRAPQGLYRLSDEADAALKAAVSDYSRNLETTSRVIANKREMILAEHVQDAENQLLASPVGTGIALTVAWLRPLGFFFLGLTAPAVQMVLTNQPVQSGQFVTGVVGGCILGATWALDAQTVRIKRLFRKARKESAVADQVSAGAAGAQ
jgi:hypothetical protein